MLRWLLLGILPFCAASCFQFSIPESLQSTLSGTWDWSQATDSCDPDKVHRFSFHDEGTKMLVHQGRGAWSGDGVERSATEYQVVFASHDGIRAKIPYEWRKTDEGEPVVWDLILLDENTYCWGRADWPTSACSQAINRCTE